MAASRLTARATLLLPTAATIECKLFATVTARTSAPSAAKEREQVSSSIPRGVAFDAAGHIVVVELGNHRVQVLRYSDGAHVRTIGSQGSGNGQFNSPCGGIAIDSDGRMVVADTCNHRVQVFQ